VYKDEGDSAQVSYVTFNPETIADSLVSVSEDEIRRYYDANKKAYERSGRAVLSLLTLPRTITAADTAAARARAVSLREEISKGASFEDVAQRESADTTTAVNGGSLGMSTRDRFVPEFSNAAFALRTGEVSQPVLSPFGYHLIKVDSRKGDSISVRHILLRIQQSDSSALITDRQADQLARIAASSTEPERFDSAAASLSLAPTRVQAFEGQPVMTAQGIAAGISAWAFGGVRAGESSELFDTETAYYLARLDTLVESGAAPLADVREDIRATIARKKKAELLVSRAGELARDAAGQGLEAAARVRDIPVQKTGMFTRPGFVPGLGRLNAAIGAAFGLPTGSISEPIITDQGVLVIRVDRRVAASREEWEKQKEAQRRDALNSLRQTRVRMFLESLRERAKIDDRRKRLNAAARQQV
jgi:peptidyl-prolyl cis-trans isomerase D